MANLLNFKFGAFASLPESKSAGTVYVTTDEQAMYIDLPNKDTPTTIDRIRIGDIIVKNSARTAEPPFAEGAFYYFIEENALLRWDGTDWVQINSVKAVDDKITNISNLLSAEVKRSTEKDTAHDTAISNLEKAVAARVTTEDFNAFKSSNTDAIADAKKAGTDAAVAAKAADDKAVAAQNTANTAQSKANEAYNLANSKATIDDVKALDYATKTEAQGYASAVLGAEGNSSSANTVYGAKAAAAAAQSKANDAYNLANSKTTLQEVKNLNYATKTEAQGYADDVLGANGDTATANTVYGAKAAAAAAQSKADAAATAASTADGKAVAAQNTANSASSAAQTADAKAVTAQGAADAAAEAAEAANNNANTRVLSSDFETFKTTNSEAIADAKLAGTNANAVAVAATTAANKAQTTADGAVEDAAKALARANEMLPLVGGTMSGNITMSNKTITGLATPSNNTDAATKKYVDDAKSAAISKANDASNAASAAAATANAALPKAGGTMTGAINMGSKQITNLAAPSAGTDATNKTYVDEAIAAGIKANDAMTFKGTVGTGGTVSALPNTAQKGDTYKVSTKGTYANIEAKVGDLFINVADDNKTASWTHISSGYEDDYLQKIAASGNTLHLTDGVTNSQTGSVSSITIVGDESSNLLFTVNSTGFSHTVTASMVWGEF